jgi:hypothetical protein
MMVLGVFNIPINGTHVRERNHTQAEALLPAYRSGVCDAKWVGYNITAGMVLVACKLPNTNPAQCLLVGYRVTENVGETVLVEDAYNTTAYVDLCSRAYNRKGFLGWDDAGTWLVAPLDLKAAIISAFGEP